MSKNKIPTTSWRRVPQLLVGTAAIRQYPYFAVAVAASIVGFAGRVFLARRVLQQLRVDQFGRNLDVAHHRAADETGLERGQLRILFGLHDSHVQ